MDIVFGENYFYCLYDHCLVVFSWFKSFILVFICECRVEIQCTIPSFARNRPLILFLLSWAPLDNSIS